MFEWKYFIVGNYRRSELRNDVFRRITETIWIKKLNCYHTLTSPSWKMYFHLLNSVSISDRKIPTHNKTKLNRQHPITNLQNSSWYFARIYADSHLTWLRVTNDIWWSSTFTLSYRSRCRKSLTTFMDEVEYRCDSVRLGMDRITKHFRRLRR